MKVLAPALASAGVLVIAAAAPAQHRAESQLAVRKVVADAADAWNRHDITAFGQLFAEDADFVPISGVPLKGRAEIEAHHAKLQAADYKDGQLAWKPVGIRFLRPDIAVVHVATEITYNAARDKRTSFATLTLTKQGGQWLIAALQNTLTSGAPASAAAAALPEGRSDATRSTAQPAPDAAQLTGLLNEFLAGASRNDPAVHERFWADALVYTGSAGRRIGKADIMTDVRSAAGKPDDRPTVYTAEDVRIQQYGDVAVVAFRLVGTTRKDGTVQVGRYLNTGTFLKRSGRWQAVSWQATRMPRPEEEARQDVAATESAFHRAVLAGDVKALQSLLDERFVWTSTGEQMTRKELLDDLASGQLKYSKLETSDVTIALHGDTAVVRGRSQQQRSAIPRGEGRGKSDPAPFTAVYTLTFVNGAEGWKAVAMHSNRPQEN